MRTLGDLCLLTVFRCRLKPPPRQTFSGPYPRVCESGSESVSAAVEMQKSARIAGGQGNVIRLDQLPNVIISRPCHPSARGARPGRDRTSPDVGGLLAASGSARRPSDDEHRVPGGDEPLLLVPACTPHRPRRVRGGHDGPAHHRAVQRRHPRRGPTALHGKRSRRHHRAGRVISRLDPLRERPEVLERTPRGCPARWSVSPADSASPRCIRPS